VKAFGLPGTLTFQLGGLVQPEPAGHGGSLQAAVHPELREQALPGLLPLYTLQSVGRP
jgi:hypothetical protein